MTTSLTQSHQPLQLAVTQTVERTRRRHNIPGISLAVTSADRLLFAGGFGHSDLITRTPATSATVYPWFSLTKIATATAALRLADNGNLGLDEHVSSYLPNVDVDRAGERPTVRQLLNHTAGLANPLPIRRVRPAHAPSPDQTELLRVALERRGAVRHQPGGPARYSNVGFLLLAEVIAAVTREPFTEHTTREILEPLSMASTGFDLEPSPDEGTGYLRAPRPVSAIVSKVLPDGIVGRRVGRYTAFNPFRVNGAGYGGLVGDVIDAARLAALHLGNGTLDGRTILRSSTAVAMRTITTPGKRFDLGLGWFQTRKLRGRTAVEHLGSGGGFYNAMRLYPDLGIGIVAMANTTTPYDHHTLFDAIAQLDWNTPE